MNLNYRLGKWVLRISLFPTQQIGGFTSLCDNGQHIIMWEFDTTPLEKIIGELSKIYKTSKLAPIQIFESSPGHYHAICPSILEFRDLIMLQASCTYTELNSIIWTIRRRKATLRLTMKDHGYAPRYIATIGEENEHREYPVSRPHRKMLKLWHSLKYDMRRGKGETIELVNYETPKTGSI